MEGDDNNEEWSETSLANSHVPRRPVWVRGKPEVKMKVRRSSSINFADHSRDFYLYSKKEY